MSGDGIDRNFAGHVARVSTGAFRVAWKVVFMAASMGIFVVACHQSEQPDPERIIQEANELIRHGEYSEGLEKMRALVDANPDDARIQMGYGEALISAGQPSLAVWPLSRAMRDPEFLVPSGLLLARAQLWAGSGIDAINTATRVLEADQENTAALLLRIEALLRESLEERALEDLDRAEMFDVDPAQIDLLRLDALLGLGREQEAEELLARLTQEAADTRDLDPQRAARLCAATATFTYERGDIEGAKERFDACLEGDGIEYGMVVHAAIDFFDRYGEADRATEIFERRFEWEPSRLVTRVQYANRLQSMGRAEEGEALLLEATESQPAAWVALADLYAIDGKLRKAVDAIDQVNAADSTQREDLTFARADLLLALGEIDEAERSLDALEIPAHRALLKARIAASRGNLDVAIDNFEEGIRLWPDNPDARYLAAQVFERRGEWRQAAAHYREAARMENPHYASSLALAELENALGDMEGVNFLLARLVEKRPNDPKVVERLIEFAWDTGASELGARMLSRLSRIRGQATHAAVLMSARVEKVDGPAAALAMLDKSGIDVLAPANVEALETRVHLLGELGRNDEALQLIGKAISRAPESARLLVLRASVHRKRNESDAVLADLRAARERDGRYLPGLLALADLERANGRPEIARDLYEEAIRVEVAEATPAEPSDSKAAMAMARFEIETGKLDAARARLRKVLDEHPRQGEAAWLLLQSYEAHPGRGQLVDEERSDLALRASVFEGSPAARKYWQQLNAGAS